jgi:hypothetical protein
MKHLEGKLISIGRSRFLIIRRKISHIDGTIPSIKGEKKSAVSNNNRFLKKNLFFLYVK